MFRNLNISLIKSYRNIATITTAGFVYGVATFGDDQKGKTDILEAKRGIEDARLCLNRLHMCHRLVENSLECNRR